MKFIAPCLSVLLSSALVCSASSESVNVEPQFFGVNLAGADFGSAFPGSFGKDYTYPTAAELDYYLSKNLRLVRLPVKWERLQLQLNGELNATELARMDEFINAAAQRKMKVIVDLHNYCRRNMNSKDYIIGTESLTVQNIQDFWFKLSDHLKNKTNIWAYGLMNEPYEMPKPDSWFKIAQGLIDTIRSTDKSTRILVAGNHWSSAELWPEKSDELKNLKDPAHKLVFEAHTYFDENSSGAYAKTYVEQKATARIGVDRVKPFVNWIEQNKLKGFIGEYGIPQDSAWLPALDLFLGYLSSHCMTGTYWAGGPWWGGYKLSIEPKKDQDALQMSVVQQYTQLNPKKCKL